jgi:chromosome transmission fidelity protein 1
MVCVDPDEPGWVIEQARSRKRRELLRQREEIEAQLKKIRAKEKAQRDKYMKGDSEFKKRKLDKKIVGDLDDEEQFVLDDYESDHESGDGGSKTGEDRGYSTETLALMSKLGMVHDSNNQEEDEVEDEIKVALIS